MKRAEAGFYAALAQSQGPPRKRKGKKAKKDSAGRMRLNRFQRAPLEA